LLGKGGKIIEQMREETGAQIRILPKEQLPGCALPTDELVQVMHLTSVLKVCKSTKEPP
jgi:poly(rC)-binding protein 2/3/4